MRPGRHIQYPQNHRHVVLDGLHREIERARNQLVRLPENEEFENVGLPGRQAARRRETANWRRISDTEAFEGSSQATARRRLRSRLRRRDMDEDRKSVV